MEPNMGKKPFSLAEKFAEVEEQLPLDSLKPFVNKVKGKLFLVFGEPAVGKTSLAILLTYFFNKTVWFKIDKNYTKEELKKLAKNVDIREIDEPLHLQRAIEKLYEAVKEGSDIDFVVIDSITTLQANFYKGKFSPRRANEFTQYVDYLLNLLSKIAQKGVTVMLIAHEKIKDFESQERIPRMNIINLRNVPLAFRMIKQGDTIVIKKWLERDFSKIKEKPYKFVIEL